MGCCASVEQGQGARVRNDQIEQQLRMEKLNEKNEVKLLLLGAGESGKSTILKQMKLIHDGGFPLEEREAHKEIIFNNALQSILVILEAMCNLGIELGDPKNKIHFDNIMRYETQVDNFTMPPDLVEGIKVLWQDSGVQETFRRSNEYQLNDSAS
ncbi:Putative G protein alpha subunit [Rhizopus microsporus]|nr:Putative G protein alpha subunit [Rhizopus microsporus]